MNCQWHKCKNEARSHIFNSDMTDSAYLCFFHRKVALINLELHDRIHSPDSGIVKTDVQKNIKNSKKLMRPTSESVVPINNRPTQKEEDTQKETHKIIPQIGIAPRIREKK